MCAIGFVYHAIVPPLLTLEVSFLFAKSHYSYSRRSNFQNSPFLSSVVREKNLYFNFVLTTFLFGNRGKLFCNPFRSRCGNTDRCERVIHGRQGLRLLLMAAGLVNQRAFTTCGYSRFKALLPSDEMVCSFLRRRRLWQPATIDVPADVATTGSEVSSLLAAATAGIGDRARPFLSAFRNAPCLSSTSSPSGGSAEEQVVGAATTTAQGASLELRRRKCT